MQDSKLDQLMHYILRGWALTPLHDVGGVVGGHCSCGTVGCASAGKHPRVAQWQRPENLIMDVPALQAAHAALPMANWGLATGPISRVWAIDYDPKALFGASDDEVSTATALLAVLNDVGTWTQRTGSEGRHWCFAEPEDFTPNNSARRLPRGFDVRGARRGEVSGGQIVLAPSVSGVGPYEVLGAAGELVRAAPAEVLALVRPTPPRERTASAYALAGVPLSADAATRYVVAAVLGELGQLRSTWARRNDRAWQAATRVLELANTGLVPREQVYTAWWAAAAGHPDPAVHVPDVELLSVWGSAERHVGDRPADLSAVGGAPGWMGGAGVLPFAAAAAVPSSAGSLDGGAPALGVAGEVTRPSAPGPVAQDAVEVVARRVDLRPYLEGTFVAPDPTYGGWRDDGKQMLYPGRWHTVVALNAAGKSWFALWHCLEEMRRGSMVIYMHFEEPSPMGTIQRLRALGAKDEWIEERFVWYDTNTRWLPGETGAYLRALGTVPVLMVLDGINAACSQHGWSVDKPEGVGAYRTQFVTPATSMGTAVISLGHPPKARDRQEERHGFGSTAWLDEVDGVGFRMEASAKNPFLPGEVGYSDVFAVKDRYGQVSRLGERVEKGDSAWYDLGALQLNSESEGHCAMRMLTPHAEKDDAGGADRRVIDAARKVLALLLSKAPAELGTREIEHAVKARKDTVTDARHWLEAQGAILITRGRTVKHQYIKSVESWD